MARLAWCCPNTGITWELGAGSCPLQPRRLGTAGSILRQPSLPSRGFAFSVRHCCGHEASARQFVQPPLGLPELSKGSLRAGICTKERLLCPAVTVPPREKLLEAFDCLAGTSYQNRECAPSTADSTVLFLTSRF